MGNNLKKRDNVQDSDNQADLGSSSQATPISATIPSDDGHATDDGPSTDNVVPQITDTAPKRVHDFGDLVRAGSYLLAFVLVVLVSLYLKGLTAGVESDVHTTAGHALEWLVDFPTSLLQQFVTTVIVIWVLVQLLINREWQQAITSTLALFSGYTVIRLLSMLIIHIGNQTLIEALSSSALLTGIGFLPDIYAGLGAFLTAAGPRRMRNSLVWGWNLLLGVGIVSVALSSNSLSGSLVSITVGCMLGMLIRFASGTQNKGAWGNEIVQSVRTIGISTAVLERLSEDDSHAMHSGDPQDERQQAQVRDAQSGSSLLDDNTSQSRIYRLVDTQGRSYVVSVLDNQTHTAGYLLQVWRWIKFSGIAMRRDRSAYDTTEHHLSMLLGLRNLGLTAAHPYAMSAVGESSVLVFDTDVRLEKLDLDGIDDDDARQMMHYLETAHRHGYTHRHISASNLSRDEHGNVVIAGWQNGDYASSSPNMSIDRVQLLVLLCCTIGRERTLNIACAVWGKDAVIQLAPFMQKVAIPASTCALPTWGKNTIRDLRDDVRKLSDEEAVESLETVNLSRFSFRSFAALVLLIVAVVVIITQLNLQQVIDAVTHANPWMAGLCFLFGVMAWLGGAISLGTFVDRDKRNYLGLFLTQVASSFTAVSMPSGVGPAFVNLQYLRKSGYKNSIATAIMSAVVAVQFATTFLLLVFIGIFTGRSSFSGMIPTNTLVVVIGVLAIIIALAIAITPVRQYAMKRLLPIVSTYTRQLLDVLTQPKELIISSLGSWLQSFGLGFGYWAALMAFGYHTNIMETTFIYLLANTIGSAVPTPGGLGAVEAALTFGFSSLGVPTALSLSATVLFRVATYWIRIPLGALAAKWLERHSLL
ncbi:MAG: lysylphosphatidylglycerol synthase transmembrane domain-containing protein [Bifidobacterium sp.]|uniref:Lysylphosphatidylglycerol synthase transmembrane domain-containing protein n=1 Tax=Bifidobacterium fermentum TaxID=3059035 RepID=A0AB39UPK8_9BIFI